MIVRMIRVTMVLEVEADTVSENGFDVDFEPFMNLVENLIRDGLTHAEPNLQYMSKIRLEPFEKE